MKIRFAFWQWVIAFAILSAGPSIGAEVQTEYMAVYRDGAKIGYTETTRSVEGKKVHTSSQVILNTKKSGGWKIDMVETVNGTPLSVSQETIDGTSSKRVTITDGQMEIRNEVNGSITSTQQQYPNDGLLAEGELRLTKRKGLTPGTTYSFTVFDVDTIAPETVTMEVGPLEDVLVLDRKEQLHRVIRRQGKIVATNYMTDDFDVRKVLLDVSGLQLEMIACDKNLALSANNAQLDFTSTANLPLPADISNYRSAEEMRLLLVPDGKTTFTIPSTGAQTVSSRPDGSYEIIVRTTGAVPASKFPYEGNDPEAKAALESTAAYACQDERIIDAARTAVGDCKDGDQACRLLEKWVSMYIVNKTECDDESATSILENRHGNCRQHAILLLTLCRALGIPSRSVYGLCCVNGRELAGHAWVECYIGNQWIDYDAAQNGFDVGHVALWIGSGEFDGLDLLAKYGHLKATSVELKMPWTERWRSPATVGGGIFIVCILLYRRHCRRKRSLQPASQSGDNSQRFIFTL